MKTSTRLSLKSGAKGWLPALLVTAALMLSGAPPVWADDDDYHDSDESSFGSKTLLRVFQDTYARWAYGISNISLPKDSNGNTVLNGIAFIPLPNTPGDGTPGQTNVTLKDGQSFFLPLIALLGTTYTDGTPPDPFADYSKLFEKNLTLKLTIDGKTIFEEDDAEDIYTQFLFDPKIPLNTRPYDSIIWFAGVGSLHKPLSPGRHVIKLDEKLIVPASVFGSAYTVEYHNTFNVTVPLRVVPPNERYRGKTYAEWSAKWWEWFLEFPVNKTNDPHPSVISPKFDVRDEQSGDVWFLAAPDGTNSRSITVPDDKALFFPLANVEVSNLETNTPFFGATEADQRARARFLANRIGDLFCTINGVPVATPGSYRVSSPQFKFDAPTPWIYGAPPNFPGGKGKAVGDGYYVLIEPLPKGEHTLHFGAVFHFRAGDLGPGSGNLEVPIDMTYQVKVK